MNIVIAIDSLKGSLTSLEAGQALAEGIARVLPSASLCVRPLADGGEGTVEALVSDMDGVFQQITVTGPLGEPVTCTYGMIKKADSYFGNVTSCRSYACSGRKKGIRCLLLPLEWER